MTPTFVTDLATTTVDTIETVLTGSLPSVFTLFAGLLALGIAVYYIRKLIQRRK